MLEKRGWLIDMIGVAMALQLYCDFLNNFYIEFRPARELSAAELIFQLIRWKVS